jgi:LPS O-antigen subunit length determinant protein (WzzB/FepE family)
MKKNYPYIVEDEIDLVALIKALWREKVLISLISIIVALLICLWVSFQPQEFITEIKIKNPPSQLFESYTEKFIEISTIGNNNDNNNNNNNNNNKIVEQFISNFELNFLSLDNLERFAEESQGFDNFKEYLKLKNVSVKSYFRNKLGKVREKNIIIPSTYFFVFEKKILDGNIFFNNYAEFIKKKTILEFKKYLKLSIENRINMYEDAFEVAKLINLEDPILKSLNSQTQVVNDPEALFFKGRKILAQEIIHLKKLLQKLENDQFNYNFILDKSSKPILNSLNLYLFFVFGLILGFLLSLVIIFLRNAFKEKL